MGALADLRALAEQATPGPWKIYGARPGVAAKAGFGWVEWVAEEVGMTDDARFIAACDPQTVLALVEVAEAAQALAELDPYGVHSSAIYAIRAALAGLGITAEETATDAS